MTVIEHCDVVLTGGSVVTDADVLFKGNGWIRVGDGPGYTYYPPHRVTGIEKPGGDA